ncbi:MAG: DNA polymerase III subunit beta [bacterium]|nr:DNA polymerase III subunit beta [bacterium]
MPTTTTNNINIIVLRSKLLEALSSVQSSVGGGQASLPILRNVRIRVFDGSIQLTTTDLTLLVQYTLSGKTSGNGEFTVPFQIFFEIIKNLTSERITLEWSEQALRIITDNYEANVRGQDAKDFPIIPSIDNSRVSLSFQTNVFQEALSHVSFATQFSDIRPEISGVHIHSDGDQLVFVATDSFRLAKRILPPTSFISSSNSVSFTLPIRTVQDLSRIFGQDDEEEIKVSVDSGQALFETASRLVISRLVLGSFPDYTQIIPREFRGEARVEGKEFLHAVKIVSSLSGKTNDMVVEVGGNKKFLEIRASESTLGENIYKIPAKISGDAFSVIFNWRYVLDGLRVYEGGEVDLRVGGTDKPAALVSPERPHLLYIVMPIKG